MVTKLELCFFSFKVTNLKEETICNESSTAVLLLADIMPSFVMNIVCPYIIGYTK